MVKDDKKTVYVKNLPYAAEDADLAAHFEQAGPVVDVRRGAAPDGAPARRTLCVLKHQGASYGPKLQIVAADGAPKLFCYPTKLESLNDKHVR